MLSNKSNPAPVLRIFVAGLLVSMGLAAGSAVASVIAVDDWHLTTDAFGGIKQSNVADNVYFAVSRETTWNPADEYEMPTGYRWASSAEYVAIMSGLPQVSQYTYYGQGGWSGYRWEGSNRYHFRFSDSNINGAYKHAGNYDHHVSYGSSYYNYNHYHAGFVMIAEAVPEPGTLALLGLGLAGLRWSRRSKPALSPRL